MNTPLEYQLEMHPFDLRSYQIPRYTRIEDEAWGAASAAPAFSLYPPEDTMSTRRWLLPFTYGIDLHAIGSVMNLAEAAGAMPVAVALLERPTRPGKRGVRLEDIQQATDFLEAVNNQATRLGVPVERHKVVTHDIVKSLTTLIAELGCEAIVLVSRKGEEIFLEAHQFKQVLEAPPAPLVLLRLTARATSQSPWKRLLAWRWRPGEESAGIGQTIPEQEKLLWIRTEDHRQT